METKNTMPAGDRAEVLTQPGDEPAWLAPPHRILFPTDFGPASEQAWTRALKLAQRLSAKLAILHVIQLDATEFEGGGGFLGYDVMEDSLRRITEGPLAEMQAEAEAAGVDVQTAAVAGRVRGEILRAAAAERTTFIVMGAHDRSGWRNFLGSVAEFVAARSPCPVWIVRYAPQPAGLPLRSVNSSRWVGFWQSLRHGRQHA